MTFGRFTLWMLVLINPVISNASASYQQPQRPSRTEIEVSRGREEQERQAQAQARRDADEAARKIFEQYHTEGCVQSGDWTRKGEIVRNKYEADNEYKPRYWFTQFRGLYPITPNINRGVERPDAATRANYPDVEYVAKYYITAEVSRNFNCSIQTAPGEVASGFRDCRWTQWKSPAPVMSMTLWRRRGIWQVKEKIEFLSEHNVLDWYQSDRSRPTCEEVTRGKTIRAQREESAAAERSSRIAMQNQAVVNSNAQEAEQTFGAEAPRLIESLFSSCRALSNSCYYRVTNYTWNAGAAVGGDDIKPWLRDRFEPSPGTMYIERPITINLLSYRGNCNGWIEPKSSFQVMLRYNFYNKRWELKGSDREAYITRARSREEIDFNALQRAESAPRLCR